jgi:cation diffusion facilitator family transporter
MRRFRHGFRAALTGILVNAFLAAVKLIAGIAGNSFALVADAVESIADVVSSSIVIGGLAVSQIPPDEDHPYGHGKAESLAGAAISVLILAAAVGVAFQAVRGIISPGAPPEPFTLPVLAAVVIAKELLARHLRRVGDRIASSAVRGDAWHQRSDAITSAAAFLGISTALIGGEGFEAADDWAALAAAVVIAAGGARLLRSAVGELMDQAPAGDLLARAVEVAGRQEGVRAVEKNWLRKVGFRYFLEIHVEVDPRLTVAEGHEIAHRAAGAVKAAFPEIEGVSVHIEPEGGAR